MKHKFSIGTIGQYDNILKKIIETEKDVNCIFKFKLLGIRKSFEPIMQNIELIRNELITKYGTEDDEHKVSIKPDDKENFDKFVAEMNKFIATEVTVDFEKIKMQEAFSGGLTDSNYLVGLYDIISQEEI